MPRKALTTFCLFLATLSLVGFGCKKKSTVPTAGNKSSVTAGAKNQTNPSATNGASSDGYVAPELVYLRQVMRNFAAVNSFRAHMVLPTDIGKDLGDLDYARGQGMHGFLQPSRLPSQEIYVLPEQILFRSGTGTWLNLIFTEEGQRIRDNFASAFNISNNPASYISDSARIVSVEEDATKGCKRYLFTQDSLDESQQTLFLCVKNDLPLIMGTVTRYGDMEVTYRDFNSKIAISSPLK